MSRIISKGESVTSDVRIGIFEGLLTQSGMYSELKIICGEKYI